MPTNPLPDERLDALEELLCYAYSLGYSDRPGDMCWQDRRCSLMARLAATPSLAEFRDPRADWRLIETAPHGRDLLVGFGSGIGWRAHVAAYEAGHWWSMGYRIQPTHWQPLPDPPAIRALIEESRDAG